MAYIVSSGITSDGIILRNNSMTILDGGTANNTAIHDGRLYVSSGGTANYTKISGSILINLSQTLQGSGGKLYVSNGGIANYTSVFFSGGLHVCSGGTAVQTIISSGGMLVVSNGGSANNVTAWDDGQISALSGALVNSVYVNGGHSIVSGGGDQINAAKLNISWGAVVNSTTVNAGYVYLEGTLNNAVLRGDTNSTGWLLVSRGGIANNVVMSGGYLKVSSGGRANNVAIESGLVTVSSGGILNGASVSRGGRLVLSGGKLTGQMLFDNSAFISAYSGYSGGTLDFDLTQTAPNGGVLVNNLSVLQGNFLYTLTVSDKQRKGLYNLATNASKFYGTISVMNTGGNKVGLIGVGETITVGEADYTLKLNNGLLTLFVERDDDNDLILPTVSNIKASTTMPTSGTVTVTADFADNVELKSSLYRIGENGSWKDYENGVTVSENTTVYFKAIDTSGNESTIASYTVTNINVGPVLDPDHNTWLYNKKTKEWNEDIPDFFMNNVTAGDSLIFLDKKSVESEVGWSNSLGRTGTEEDAADYAKIELAKGAALKFSVDSTVAGTFYVYEKTADKNGTPVTTQRQKITVKANKTSPAKLTTIYLEKGEYFVGMEAKLPSATDKPEFSAYYNVNLTGTKFYNDADDGWNNHVYQLDEKGKEIKTKLNTKLVNDALVFERGVADIKIDTGTMDTDVWVGFSDSIDYKMLTLKKAVNMTLLFSTTDNAKLTLWAVSFKNGKYTLTNKGGVTVKAGKTGWVKSKFLAAGSYFISVASTNATKGGNAYYSVLIIDNKTVFFDSADNGKNNVLYNKKGKAFFDDAQHTFVTTAVNGTEIKVQLDSGPVGADGYENFVGYQDKADYAKITLVADGNLSFNLKTSGNATFAVYKKGKDKKGNDTLETIQTTKLARAYGKTTVEATTDLLTGLKAGEYYVSMTAKSTKANASGSVFYNVTATLEPSVADALSMPETDTLGISDALSFGQYDTDALAGASCDLATQLIFEESGKGMLASL